MTDQLTLEQLENMTDEEFAKVSFSQLPVDDTPVNVDEPPVEEQPQEPAQEPEPTQEPEPVPDNPIATSPELTSIPNGQVSEAEPVQAGDGKEVAGEGADPTEVPTPEVTQEVQVTPEKAFFDKVTAEFNANGKAHKIDNADDAVKLMQMGLNYNQKMAAMKPSMKLVRALQDRGINSLEDLGGLLDLHDKKPEAIAALVQASGIDTYQIEDQAKGYVPSVPQVNDQAIEFEMVAKSLEGNPHFSTVVQHLGTFDEATKQEVFNKPYLLNVLTDHVQNGFYDKIMSRYELESALGRTQGMTFLQAYDRIGEALFAQPEQVAPVQQVAPVAAPVAQPVPVPVAQNVKPSNNAARQAAAGVKANAATTQKLTLTPEELWNMSDEEFKKIDPKFL